MHLCRMGRLGPIVTLSSLLSAFLWGQGPAHAQSVTVDDRAEARKIGYAGVEAYNSGMYPLARSIL